jgi:hypothetical protein
MVRDAYSAGGQPQQADTSTANLTQELALLLAQSIAQGQSGRRPPGAAATGSELASLAALVSASQNQRGQPYKDGLSSLSYARPAHAPPVAPMAPPMAPMAPAMPAASGLLVPEPHHEDEPMPIPSTWRQPTVSDDDRWYRQQLGAAALGLIAGLVVVVPAVLWLSGYLGGPQAKASVKMTNANAVPVTEYNAASSSFESRPVPVVKVDPGPPKVEPRAAVTERAALPTPQPQPRVEPVRSRNADLMVEAKRRIDGGDVVGAREVLKAPETDASGPMMFMLAETFDPNMLASWQTKGVTANPERARALYEKARDLGDGRARQRLSDEWWLGGG